MFGNHGLCGLLEEGAHEKSPKCLGWEFRGFGGDFAKVSGHLGGSAWAAESQTGGNLILTGEAEMGGRVFYDQHTNRITGRAPDLAVTDLPLV